ncbi:MAG: InlB B-repeat-containing protein, partial [Oscillospiraceae bacterium]|nr:InlB B-repeat-containing protein [Oscillospiraceae bacterium]
MKKRIIILILTATLLLTLVPFAGIRAQAASNFVASDAFVEVLKKWEGFSAKPYWDYRQWTVGYGTRVPDGKLEEYQQIGISNEEATQLLHSMLNDMGKDLNNFIDKFGLTMNQGQFDALLSLTFNCGPNWMWEPSTFRTSVIEGWKGNDFIFAIGQWSTAGGVTVPALVRRRLAEAHMYLNGVYNYTPPENYAYVRFDANGGETEIITQGYDLNVTAAIRAVPVYEGYKFEGWYTDPTGGEKVEVLDAGVRNYMLYAHWSAGDGADLPQDTTEEVSGTPVNYQKQIATGVLNSFDKPVKGALVVNAYRLGEIVDVCAEYTDTNGLKWGKLSGGGWINLSYTQDPQAEDVNGEGVKITVTADDVNIRRGPGTSYALTGKANRGDQMIITQTATGSGYTWGKSANGWICLKYTNYDEVANQNPDNEDAGNENTGNENTGNENTGNENTGNENTGNENTGNENIGNENTGNGNTGNVNTGNENTG